MIEDNRNIWFQIYSTSLSAERARHLWLILAFTWVVGRVAGEVTWPARIVAAPAQTQKTPHHLPQISKPTSQPFYQDPKHHDFPVSQQPERRRPSPSLLCRYCFDDCRHSALLSPVSHPLCAGGIRERSGLTGRLSVLAFETRSPPISLTSPSPRIHNTETESRAELLSLVLLHTCKNLSADTPRSV